MEILTCILVSSIISVATPAKILLLPFSFTSHVSELYNIGLNLVDRNHKVYMLLSPSLPDIEKWKKGPISIITHHIIEKDIYSIPQDDFDQMFEDLMKITLLEDLRESVEGYIQLCTNPLTDQELFKKLKSLHFDLALVDTYVGSRCLTILPYRLDVPFVNLKTHYEPWLLRNPALPSFVPFNMYKSKSTDMNFLERLDNIYRQLEWIIFPKLPYLDHTYLGQFFVDKPQIPINQLAGQALLWFVNTDFAIDYPRPTMPNEILIGGLTTHQPVKPLPADIDGLVQQSKGVIIVSFGSMGSNLPEEARMNFLKAFSKVQYVVLWRYPHSPPESIPSNVKLLKWLPQQDLLAHSKTKLLITHCGANSQFEALYHAVPMIGMPLFAEQHYNAKRAEYKGFGVSLNMLNFTVEEMITSINYIIENNTFQNKIEKASKIFRSSPMKPEERATWWIEHVLEHGGSHLRAYALEMPWYEYLMLDILAFVSIVTLTVACILCRCCRFCIHIIRGKNGNGKKNKTD